MREGSMWSHILAQIVDVVVVVIFLTLLGQGNGIMEPKMVKNMIVYRFLHYQHTS